MRLDRRRSPRRVSDAGAMRADRGVGVASASIRVIRALGRGSRVQRDNYEGRLSTIRLAKKMAVIE